MVCTGSPWAVTAICYSASWSEASIATHLPERIGTFVSLIVSDWHAPGTFNRNNAAQCSEDELLAEAWAQFVESFRGDPLYSTLKAVQPSIAFLGPGLRKLGERGFANLDPLFVNTAGSYDARPEAVSRIDGLTIAADFVRTNADLTTMESACEAGRRAANGILVRTGLSDNPCMVSGLKEPMPLAIWKALDRRMFEAGEPPVLSVVPKPLRRSVLQLIQSFATDQQVPDVLQTIRDVTAKANLQDAADLFDAFLPLLDSYGRSPPSADGLKEPSQPSVTDARSCGEIGPIEPIVLSNRLRTLFFLPPIVLDTRTRREFEQGHVVRAHCLEEGPSVEEALKSLPKATFDDLRSRHPQLVILYGAEAQPDGWMQQVADHLAARGNEVRLLTVDFASFSRQRPFACAGPAGRNGPKMNGETADWPIEVIDNFLFVGSARHADDHEMLHRCGVTHIFNVAAELKGQATEGFETHHVPLVDRVDAPLLPHLEPVTRAILDLHERGQGRCLVHCRLGIDRSVSVALATMMRLNQCSFDAALQRMRWIHPDATPNAGFVEQLRAFGASFGVDAATGAPVEPEYRTRAQYPPLPDDVDPDGLPSHIGIIMDGNRRWARLRDRNPSQGHRRGRAVVSDTLYTLAAWGIPAVTLYAFSVENWSRPPREVEMILDLIEITLLRELPRFVEWGIRVHVAGDLDDTRIPSSFRHSVELAEHTTLDCGRHILTLAVNYGARQEMVRCINALVAERNNGRGANHPVRIEDVSARLSDIAPGGDIDLMIRTSGERRLSNFMLWELSYSELYFTPKLFPELSEEDLTDAILSYQGRERRFGH